MNIFKPHKDSYALIIILLTVIVANTIASKLTTFTLMVIFKFELQHLIPDLGGYTWDIVFWGLYILYAIIAVAGMYHYFKPKKGVVDEPCFKYEGYPAGVVPTDKRNFSWALTMLLEGHRVRRSSRADGWDNPYTWLSVSNLEGREVVAENFWSPHNKQHAENLGGSAMVLPAITYCDQSGNIVMGWSPSQADLFATDWELFEDE